MSKADTGPQGAKPAPGSEASAPVSEHSPPTQPWRRPPPAQPVASADAGDDDFDLHDTIPAPTWLDELPDTQKAPSPSPR